jgi:hypothetical protein
MRSPFGPSQQNPVQLRPWVPPQPSEVDLVLHVGGSLGVQHASWKQRCPAAHAVCTGVQTPPWHWLVVKIVPWQVWPAQVPHEPLQPLAPQALAGAHCGTQIQCPFWQTS